MRVAITGGAGYLGVRLGELLLRGGAGAEVEEIRIVDRAPPPTGRLADPRVRTMLGDLTSPAFLDAALEDEPDVVFHLAAMATMPAEADFDAAMALNLNAFRGLLERCRRMARPPRLVLAGSLAVFADGCEAVDDDSRLAPRSTYGATKAAAEILLADYSRRGYVDGRTLRLPIVMVRPYRTGSQLSMGFASDLVRKGLAGEDCDCPAGPEARIAVCSVRTAARGLAAFAARDLRLPPGRAACLPSLSVSMAEVAEALVRIAGPEVSRRIRWQPDPRITAIVAAWPKRMDSAAARLAGLRPDDRIDDILRHYLVDEVERR